MAKISWHSLWLLFCQAVVVVSAVVYVSFVVLRGELFPPSYSSAVSRALPSVVSIYGRDSRGIENSIGSGVIINSAGHILTNYHLIANVGSIEVELKNGESFAAEILGVDPEIDIAVLRVEADGLPAIVPAADHRLQPGDVVFAIGNPFGLNRSATMGIVSAIGRSRLGLHDFEKFIQTDAAINPGSSGGALADVNGRLVGINSALFSRQHGVKPQGIGFAIPAGLAMNAYDELTKQQPAVDNFWGMRVRQISPRLREMISRLEAGDSAYLVSRVWRNTLAAQAAIQVGDVILTINGGLPETMIQAGQVKPTATKILVLRGNEEREVHLRKL